jgi:anti-sigma B factor antagonist
VGPEQSTPDQAAGSFSVDQQTARRFDQDIAVLIVRGEIDISTAPVLLEVFLSVLERDTGPVVIDLSEVPFMDSTGVHVLVDAVRRLKPQNRRLAIACREDGQIHSLLALVGLLDALTVHRSRESAVIGGDDLIRSEPRTNRSALAATAGTQNAPVDTPGNRSGTQASRSAQHRTLPTRSLYP